MKRSEINALIGWAKDFLSQNNIRLPALAYWSPDELRRRNAQLDTVKKLELGWDITDFGSNDFATVGAVLYTVRNGLADDPTVGVPYCEKYIVMKDGQHLPNHYHVFKSEDIINRAGGDILVRLWNADRTTGKMLDTDVHVMMDGIEHVFMPGEEIIVRKGESITLSPYIAHIFGPKPGTAMSSSAKCRRSMTTIRTTTSSIRLPASPTSRRTNLRQISSAMSTESYEKNLHCACADSHL